jgi:hypothetical protein
VGGKRYWSKRWGTFHDFLFDYVRDLFGSDWGNAELAKPSKDQHPIIQWFEQNRRLRKAVKREQGKITQVPTIGAVSAFMGLAYNLYLLAHNAEIQKRLMQRLRDPGQFHGASYEVFVAGALIRAGYGLELEDEQDGSTSHCEFTAIHLPSGRKYSVEAKSRYHVAGDDKGEAALRVHRYLSRALKKRALHERIVFIDLNMPSVAQGEDQLGLLKKAAQIVRDQEPGLLIGEAPAPRAYVFLTNFPYHHFLETGGAQCAAAMEPFKIEDLRAAQAGAPLRTLIETREKHRGVTDILQKLGNTQIPSTFDGDVPELAFHVPQERRLVIGRTYNFAPEGEPPLIGEVTDVHVDEEKRELLVAIYEPKTDDAWIMKGPMSDIEFAGYRGDRDTYFGVRRKVHPEAKTILDLYDFFVEGYARSPKETMLKLMKDWPDLEAMQGLSQKELVSIYAERTAITAYQLRPAAAE